MIDKKFFENFQARILTLAQKHKVPAFSCAVINSSREHTYLHGAAANTVFPISSLSKSFATALTAILVDKGLLNWDDPVSKFDVSFKLSNPELNKQLTVRHLLSHINPLPPYALNQLEEFGFSLKEMLSKIEHVSIREKSEFSYQSVLFSGIAEIIEKVSGLSYAECLKQELLTPLGMRATTCSQQEYDSYPLKVNPHIKLGHDVVKVANPNTLLTMTPASGIASSATDLKKWLLYNLDNTHTILKAVHTPAANANPPYAMGWWQADEDGLVLCHDGFAIGFGAAMAIIPSQHLGIAITASINNEFTVTVVNEFIAAALSKPYFDIFKRLNYHELAKPQLSLCLMEGKYYNPILENLSIALEYTDDMLKAKITVEKNGASGILQPFFVGPFNRANHPELHKLSPYPCFKITWGGKMAAAGALIYYADRVAMVQDEPKEKVKTLLFLSSGVDNKIIEAKRVETATVEATITKIGALTI